MTAQTVQWIALILSLTSVYFYGRKNLWGGPLLGLLTQPLWAVLGLLSDLYALAAASLIYAALHALAAWRWWKGTP